MLLPSSIPELAAAAGFTGAVLADTGGVYGQWIHARAALESGVTAGAGSRLELGGEEVGLIAPDERGWRALCMLVTASALPERVQMEEALSHSEWLAAVCRDIPQAERLRGSVRFRGRIFVEVLPERFGRGRPEEVEGAVLSSGFEPLASWPVVFAERIDHQLHRILVAGSLGVPLSALSPAPAAGEAAPEASFLPSVKQFVEELGQARVALRHNEELLETLRTVPAKQSLCPPAAGQDADVERLRQITSARLRALYGPSRPASRRLETELAQIEEAGLSGYFVLFSDVVEYCRSNGITSVARGSAAGSLVSYLLRLSVICPIRHQLSFARFFNRLRPDPPDIDLDIESERREEVLLWTLDRLGDRGAGVAELVRLRRRGAFRRVAAAMGLGQEETDTLSSTLSRSEDPVWRREPLRGILATSRKLRGLVSHIAPHPCGVAARGEPVQWAVGVEGCNLGIPLAQFDKDGVEWMGMLKMDLLGQRGLSKVAMGCRSTSRDPYRLIMSTGKLSPGVRSILADGHTLAVAHIESPAMRDLLRQTGARNLEDVARALALVRPGAAASGGRKRFFERSGLGGSARRLFEDLEALLSENRGVLLYQEDVSLVARAVLGLDEAEADLVRRRLKKGRMTREDVEALCLSRGVGPEETEELWRLLSGYAGYGFCKAHAVTYAAVACAAATMKVESPAEHMAAVLASGGGFYRPSVYLEEARRLGVELHVPGVNSGEWLARPWKGGVMVGFHRLKGLGEACFRKLKDGRPYASAAEVLESGLGPAILCSMAMAGCFHELGQTQAEVLLMIERFSGGGDLLSGLQAGITELPEYDRARRAGLEMGLLGACVSESPLALTERPGGSVPAVDLPPIGRARCWGIPATRRSLEDDSGFLMLQDDTGVVDAYLPEGVYRRAVVLSRREAATLILEGRVIRQGRMDASSVEAGPLTPEPLVV